MIRIIITSLIRFAPALKITEIKNHEHLRFQIFISIMVQNMKYFNFMKWVKCRVVLLQFIVGNAVILCTRYTKKFISIYRHAISYQTKVWSMVNKI